MTRKELYDLIDSLSQDIEFEYNGKTGAICPFSREDISVSYGLDSVSVSSVGEAMSIRFIGGHSLDELCEKVDFW